MVSQLAPLSTVAMLGSQKMNDNAFIDNVRNRLTSLPLPKSLKNVEPVSGTQYEVINSIQSAFSRVEMRST